MNINNLPTHAAGGKALNPLVFSSIDDSPNNPRLGLGYAQLFDETRPVPLVAKLPDVTRVGDSITLYWDDEDIQNYSLDALTIEKGWLSFSVAPSLIKDPQGKVYYTLYDHVSDNLQTSATRTIVVNRQVPGGLDPDTDTVINEDLLAPIVRPERIDNANTPVTVEVPIWRHMEPGDELTVMWNGIRVQAAPLNQKTLGQLLRNVAGARSLKILGRSLKTLIFEGFTQRIRRGSGAPSAINEPQIVPIPKDVIERGGNSETILVNYEIRDIVDNYSLMSNPAYADVDIDPDALPAPLLLDKDPLTGMIDLEVLGLADARVRVLTATLSYGSRVTVTWIGRTPNHQYTETLPTQTVGIPGVEDLTFTVANDKVLDIAGGWLSVSYKLGDRFSRNADAMVSEQIVHLAAPTIQGVTGDVIDLATMTSNPVIVHAAAYLGQAVGDRISLTWAGITGAGVPMNYSAEYDVQAGQQGREVSFQVLRENLAPLGDGTLTLTYTVTKTGTGLTLTSPSTLYTVKALALVLPAPTVPEANGNILDPMNVRAGATFEVRYNGMMPQHVIAPIWNGIADTIPWSLGSVTGMIYAIVPPAMIGAVIGKTIDVLYDVLQDDQGFASAVLRLTVMPISQTALPTPVISEAQGAALNVTDLSADAHLTVDAWPYIATGQRLWLRLEGTAESGAAHNLELPDWQGYAITSDGQQSTRVPLDYLTALKDGSPLRLLLHVTFDGSLDRLSAQAFPVQSYAVLHKPEVVVPVITAVTTPQGATIPDNGSTTSTTLIVAGAAGPGTQVRIYDGAAALTVVNVDAQGRWTYQASGLAVSSHSFTARVVGMEEVASDTWVVHIANVPLVIDTSTLVLSGHLVRSGRTPTHPPAGTTATRVASGGTPPYRYSVDSNAVDINMNTGTVISYRNRQGVVTVTDSKGQTARYTVSVSNVLEIDGWNGQQVYRDAVTNAANYGGRVPTLYEWRDFRSAYGGDPQLPSGANEHAWSSTSAGGKYYYTIIPNNGAEGTQPNQSFIIGGRGAAKGWAIVVRS